MCGNADGLEHAHVTEGFLDRGFGLSIMPDALREIGDLRAELVTPPKHRAARAAAHGEVMHTLAIVVVPRLDAKVAFGAGDAVARHAGRAVRDAKLSEAAAGELKDYGRAVVGP